jgi:hypothetical protein
MNEYNLREGRQTGAITQTAASHLPIDDEVSECNLHAVGGWS